jgi:hypothetical protein
VKAVEFESVRELAEGILTELSHRDVPDSNILTTACVLFVIGLRWGGAIPDGYLDGIVERFGLDPATVAMYTERIASDGPGSQVCLTGLLDFARLRSAESVR